jgi:hypothetical protein
VNDERSIPRVLIVIDEYEILSQMMKVNKYVICIYVNKYETILFYMNAYIHELR